MGGTLVRERQKEEEAGGGEGKGGKGQREEREGGRKKEIDLKGGKIRNKIAFLIKR